MIRDVVNELAQILPERVKISPVSFTVRHSQRSHWTSWGNHNGPILLELALREEIEARGWYWSVESTPNNEYSAVIHKGVKTFSAYACASTPTEALACALMAALKAP
ncbi:hypothetical protein DEDE109153_08450 [Deinococcus deserti]